MQSTDIHKILHKYWGYEQFRPLQEDIIRSVLAGRDTLGLLPTGGGKSITFQVATLATEGIAIVVTPIISLMKDQVDNLRSRGVMATYIHSGLTMRESQLNMDRCIYGKCRFLYISPERLRSDIFIDKLRLMKVTLIVVDEAHCISQWGYDFRPSYLNIATIRDIFPNAPVLALTATAPKDVVTDITENLHFGESSQIFTNSFARKNISYVVRKSDDKLADTINILRQTTGSAIVYLRSRRKTEEIANILRNNNISANHYHAGLDSKVKEQKQDSWINNETRVMVA
ncbi:MAG: RecQ family ATP-dependent DNA helicase, partial [Bacteroidales bacterium]